MTQIVLPTPRDWESFRAAARALFARNIIPRCVIWCDADNGQLDLVEPTTLSGNAVPLRLPRSFIEAGEQVSLHRSHDRWALLYRILWRIMNETRALMEIAADEDVSRLLVLRKAVTRDMHKMTAFVRFRSVPTEKGERFVAFYKPDHLIVRATAPFFARRFPAMRWSILTPDGCVHFDDGELQFTEGVPHDPITETDPNQQLWQTYYAHTFNPARLRTKAMRAEMPTRFWSLLPETQQMHELLRAAPARTRKMIEMQGTQAMVPAIDLSLHTPERPAAAALEDPPRIRIGVAGWDYPDWSGIVYSARSGTDKLRAVAKRFQTIEVNSTFYRPVSPKAAHEWIRRVGDKPRFRFTAKLWRRFTHERHIISQHDVLQVHKGLDVLRESGRLVTVIVQFPWSFRQNQETKSWLLRLLNVFRALPLHIEFRHDSWLRKEIMGMLRDHNAGFVNIDQPALPGCITGTSYVTNPIAYVRLHGRNANNWFRSDATRDERFDYLYSNTEMMPWRNRVQSLAARTEVEGVHVVFNNHYRAQAVKNALTFARLVQAS